MEDDVRAFRLGDREVRLDPKKFAFNETNLSDYLEQEAGWYDHFGALLADAEYIAQRLEMDYDVMYSERYKEHKDNGCTDKLAESNAKADPDVIQAKTTHLAAKHKVKLLQQHLRAWDRAHENAQSRGHFLRKEMDKLGKDTIYGRPDNYLERQLGEIIKEQATGETDG